MDYMKKQILIVDDELSILKLLNFLLSKEYDLVMKQSGVDAIRWLEDGNDPALIISDLQMPYLDGSSFIRNLKTSGFYRDTPVILLSGADDLEIIVDKMPFRADCFFKKPINPVELKFSIATALTQHDITINQESTEESLPLKVAYMGTELSAQILNKLPSLFNICKYNSLEQLNQYLDNQLILNIPDVILLETDSSGECFTFIEKLKNNSLWSKLVVVIIATEKNKDWKLRALKLKVHDYYIIPFPVDHLVERLNFLVKFKLKINCL